jgi:hypothetical protein
VVEPLSADMGDEIAEAGSMYDSDDRAVFDQDDL